jgi:hypothetical protein
LEGDARPGLAAEAWVAGVRAAVCQVGPKLSGAYPIDGVRRQPDKPVEKREENVDAEAKHEGKRKDAQTKRPEIVCGQ